MAKRDKQPKWFDDYVPEEVANSSIFRFKIELYNKSIDVDMKADLEIDFDLIQDHLIDSPAEFAYWAAIYSELKMQVSKLERLIKAKRGKIVEKILQEASKAQVRITDKQIQAVVEADIDLNELEGKLLIAQKHCGKLWFMIEAMRMKSDNLRSLAGFAKQDFKG